ncbi:hypothetical protein [Variovorax sp. LT1R16]|uniref:hypothetical protein n=1 Tax=Variovorax sp. LT1R16 TaxID=3443728 RepID=UPI003F48CF4D
MPTLTSGRFFVGRQAATPQVEQDGTFSLTLRVVDNQGLHANEPYLVRWRGAEAQAWWAANGPLRPGAALQLELLNPRAQLGLRVPEIHAQVSSCRLLPPRAAPTQQHTAAQTS